MAKAVVNRILDNDYKKMQRRKQKTGQKWYKNSKQSLIAFLIFVYPSNFYFFLCESCFCKLRKINMNCCIHCLNCYCFSFQAFIVSQCIDNWHALEACGLGCLFTYACCWTLCAPLCIDCELGSRLRACNHFLKGCKYFLMGCSLNFVSTLDGLCNCYRICGRTCG